MCDIEALWKLKQMRNIFADDNLFGRLRVKECTENDVGYKLSILVHVTQNKSSKKESLWTKM